MAIYNDVFSINQVYQLMAEGEWVTTPGMPIPIANAAWAVASTVPAYTGMVQRMNFSTDTATMVTKTSLPQIQGAAASTTSLTYGWIIGGKAATTTLFSSNITKITFANDVSAPANVGSLPLAVAESSGVGNMDYGWSGGGRSGSPAIVKTHVYRITYSSDSSLAALRGPLVATTYLAASTSTSDYGWIGGGYPGPSMGSKVQRIDFANDNVTSTYRGPLSLSRRNLVGVGTPSYGWYCGGNPAPATGTRVDRIDYANDNATASIRGTLALTTYSGYGGNDDTYGWVIGGGLPTTTRIQRITFATDTALAAYRGNMATLYYGGVGVTGSG